MKRLSLIAAAAVLSTAGMASATIIGNSTPFSIAPIGATLGNPQVVTLDQFDTNLGTLLSVTIGYDGLGTGSFTFVASDNIGDTADATLNSILTVTFPNTGFGADFGSSGPHLGLNVGDSVNVGGGGGGDPAAILHGDSSPAAPFAPYEAAGGGLFNVSVLSNGGWSFIVQGSGNENTVTVQFDSSVDGEVWVEYEYREVPEPASMALLGLGGLGLIARRRIA